MSASLVLLALVPTAPVPKGPPPATPVEVTAKPYIYPPRDGGNGQLVNQDDGHFIEVTIRNTSKETLPFQTRHDHNLSDLVYVKITDPKGKEVTQKGFHLQLLCSSIEKTVKLEAGKSITVVAHLMRDLPYADRPRLAGKYTARVTFAAGDVKAESAETFELEFVK